MCLTATPSRDTAQTPASATNKWGLDREAGATLLRVRTSPECPKGNLRELTRDSNPKLWDSYPVKSPNLRHRQACSQNKGLSEFQRRASRLQTFPSPARDKQAEGQPEKERGNCSPREAVTTKLQAGFVANQDFLGFWTVNIHQEGHSQRSASQKRHTAHLVQPRKPKGRDRRGDKSQPPPAEDSTHQAPGHLSCSDLGWAQNAGPTKSAPLWSTRDLNLSGLDLGSPYNPGPASDSSQQSNLETKQCRQKKHTRRERGQTQCGRDTASTPVLFVCSVPPSPQRN